MTSPHQDILIKQMQAALKRSHREFMAVAQSIEDEKVHFDGDEFHETLEDIKNAVLAGKELLK